MVSTTTEQGAKSRPILFKGPLVRAILAGIKTQTRRVVVPANSTVLGYPAKGYWPYLLFEHAIAREKASIMVLMVGAAAAPRDIHLDVPFRRNDEGPEYPIASLPWYRVRPIWEVEDTLWVKETYCHKVDEDGFTLHDAFHYKADGDEVVAMDADGFRRFRKDGLEASPWTSSLFMPRRASRITLRVTDVRVERLGDITEADAVAEGMSWMADESGTGGWHAGTPAPARYSYRNRFRHTWDEINGKRPGCDWKSSPWVWVISFERVMP